MRWRWATLAVVAALAACDGGGGSGGLDDAGGGDVGPSDVLGDGPVAPPGDAGRETTAGEDAAEVVGVVDVVDASPDEGDARDVAELPPDGEAPPEDGSPGADVEAEDTFDAGPADTWDPEAGPPVVTLTVNAIPPEMNGSLPYLGPEHPETAFRLHLPLVGFTVDVTATPQRHGPPIDWETLSVWSESGEPAARVERTARFVASDDRGDGAVWHVDDGDVLAAGALRLGASVADVRGVEGVAEALDVELAELPAHLDPFVEPDVWLVTFSRDIFSLELVERGDGSFGLQAVDTPEGNGVPDFDEAFLALGLFSEDAAATAFVRARLIERIREVAHAVYGLDEEGQPLPGGVPIVLYFEGDPGAPDPADHADPGGFSMIAIGGDGDLWDRENGIVGRALLDANNQRQENNAVAGLGVFTTQIVRQIVSNPLAMMLLGEISPVEGTPIGMDPADAGFLREGFDVDEESDPLVKQRFTLYDLAVDFGGLGTAVTLCHEMGHSLGLVPLGAPPVGLFAGIDGLPFVDNDMDGWHVDTPGLNVMQTGRVTNWLEAISQTPRFNALNLAYLQRRLIVDPSAATKAAMPETIGCH